MIQSIFFDLSQMYVQVQVSFTVNWENLLDIPYQRGMFQNIHVNEGYNSFRTQPLHTVLHFGFHVYHGYNSLGHTLFKKSVPHISFLSKDVPT